MRGGDRGRKNNRRRTGSGRSSMLYRNGSPPSLQDDLVWFSFSLTLSEAHRHPESSIEAAHMSCPYWIPLDCLSFESLTFNVYPTDGNNYTQLRHDMALKCLKMFLYLGTHRRNVYIKFYEAGGRGNEKLPSPGRVLKLVMHWASSAQSCLDYTGSIAIGGTEINEWSTIIQDNNKKEKLLQPISGATHTSKERASSTDLILIPN